MKATMKRYHSVIHSKTYILQLYHYNKFIKYLHDLGKHCIQILKAGPIFEPVSLHIDI